MKKAFRLFISSTFEDFKIERDLLQNEVFPKIREYCESKGFSFQPIDLRWGINNEAQLDQKTLPVCLREVRNCASYPHPNFLIMLGDRYGWVPLPYIIDKKEFDDIRKNLKSSDKQLLDEWYRLDKNQLSEDGNRGCYILKRRDGAFVKYEEWYKVEEKIRQILQKASENLPEEKKKKYFMSATHHEFEEICKNESNKNFIIPIFRRFKNQKQPRNQNIENFRHSVENNIPKECKHNIINEEIDDKFKIYSKTKFIAQIVKKLKANIDAGIKELSSAPENFEHNIFKTQQIDTFLGRQKSLKKIANYLDDETDTPLIIYSHSGMGKTTLMKKAIEEAEEATLGKARIFYKFVGADGKSFYKRDLLTDLIYEIEGSSQKDNLNNLSEYDFDKHISELLSSDKDENVVIFIDALDQLKATDQLFWLPQRLGKNIKIVLSVLKDEEFRDDSIYFENLIKKYGDKNTINLNNDSLSSETKGLFENFLGKHKRTLTRDQINEVEKKFKKANCSPLYAFIISQELKNISSNDKIDIADDIPSAINEFIDNLENLYHQEELLIQKVLSYIAFSKYGISENELLDLLSKEIKSDKRFYNKVFFIKNVSLSKNISFPISLWASLSSLLEPFLTLVYKDDKLLINFFHRQFIETISKKYEKYKQETHLKLAEYFCSFEKKEELWDKRYYSPRALSELFHHLYYSNSKKFEKYLNDIELIGSIYDHYKFKDFREILDNLDEDKFLAQKSFYREKDYLFNDNTNYFKPHIVLFQLAYADGEDSQLTISAKKLLKAGKANFCWLKSSSIPANFTRTGLLEVFDWSYIKKLSNGNFLIGKTNGNFCLLSNNFKQMVDLGIKTAYDVHDIMYGCPTCNELENGNLEFTVYDDGWCDALPVNYFTNYTFTNNGKLVSINESNSAVQAWVEYFGSNTRIEHKISDYPGCYCDEYLIWYKSKLFAKANSTVIFKNKYLAFCKEEGGLYIYSTSMKLVANIPNIKQIMSISNLSCGYILINESIILTKKWQHKYTAKKVMDLSNGRMLVNTTSDIVILYKNMQTKILIENSEFDFATELKNKKILMQLENKLIIFSDYVKQVNEAELISKVKLKEYKLAYVLNNYHDHCISILPNNNILIKINNSIKLFSENMEELAFIKNLNIEKVFELSNNSLLVQVKNHIKLFSENMEELAFIKNLNIGKIINTIKNNLPTLSVQKNVVLFSKDDIKISLVKSNESSNIHQIDNYFIMVEDIFLKKFYSIKTKKLLRVLRVKGEMVSLDNTILILDSNKAYLYSFKPSCSKLETNSLIIKKSSVINCGYIVALFENGIVCIYSKNFTKLKTYKHCKDIKVKKYIFAIWYQDGKIEIIDEKLHSECINDNYELLENDCLSDNILLYNKGRFSSNLCIYIRKYRFIKYLNINSKNIIWNNNVGGFSVNNNKLIFNEYGKIIQSDIKKLCNVLDSNKWWSYEYTYNKELFECDMILTIYIYNYNFKLINTIYVADMFYENTHECKEIIKIDINSNIICSLGRYSEYNGAIFSWITTIFDSNGDRKTVIKDVFFIAQLKNNDILMSGVDKIIEIYSANYEYKMTLCKEKIDFIKELDDGSLIFTKNDKTFYYDADYRLVNSSSIFNIDATKHDKFDYIPDRRIFIYHYDPISPRVIEFEQECKIENFKDYYVVVFKHGIAILYKYIDKREFFYIPEETRVVKIYKNKCLVYNEDGFSYFMFS